MNCLLWRNCFTHADSTSLCFADMFPKSSSLRTEYNILYFTHTNVKYNFAHIILQIAEIKVKRMQSQLTSLNPRFFALFITHAARIALWKPMTSQYECDVIPATTFLRLKRSYLSLCLISDSHDDWGWLTSNARTKDRLVGRPNTISREGRDVYSILPIATFIRQQQWNSRFVFNHWLN